MLLEMAPMVGPRDYDWTKKASFLLDPTECGELICLQCVKGEQVEFFHDPFILDQEKAGQVIYLLNLKSILLFMW